MLTTNHREIPPAVARAFYKAMQDYFVEHDPHKRDAIASHQLSILKSHQGSREKPLRLSDVKQMFEQMRGTR